MKEKCPFCGPSVSGPSQQSKILKTQREIKRESQTTTYSLTGCHASRQSLIQTDETLPHRQRGPRIPQLSSYKTFSLVIIFQSYDRHFLKLKSLFNVSICLLDIKEIKVRANLEVSCVSCGKNIRNFRV